MSWTILIFLVWVVVAALILSAPPLRSRADCWWLAMLWPAALALVSAILLYEIALYRPARALLKAARR